MVGLFFYNKLKNIELIKKINDNFEIYDGYIMVQNYDSENNFLEISEKSVNNNNILYGKLVIFDTNLDDIIKKINEIEECKLENKKKYTLQKILVNKTFVGTAYEAYIIY
jgi:hypothetical protein